MRTLGRSRLRRRALFLFSGEKFVRQPCKPVFREPISAPHRQGWDMSSTAGSPLWFSGTLTLHSARVTLPLNQLTRTVTE